MDPIELVDEAKALLDSKGAFMHSVARLRKQWFNELMIIDAASPNFTTKVEATVSKLQALEAIPRELAVMISNYSMDQRRKSTPSVTPKERPPGSLPDISETPVGD